jgi:acylphosphatase
LHVVVRGRVQGVGFRWFVVQQASALGLNGWVRNNADGCVEVAARGATAALADLRRLLTQGPPASRVDAVDDLAGPATIDSPGFHVLR